MNACTSPSDMLPVATRSPPTTAIATNVRFPMNIIDGIIVPEMNWAPKLALNSSSFLASNASWASLRRPNTFTRLCPV